MVATPEVQPASPPAPPVSGPTPRDARVIAVLEAISRILAVRALLLIALIGGFVLALMAMRSESAASLFVLIAYALLVLMPFVALELLGKRGL